MNAIIQRTDYIRSKGLMASADTMPCVRCGSMWRVCSAHYTGLRQHQYGRGKSIKGHDCLTAWLCQDCHNYFDQPKNHKSLEISEDFLHCIALTLVRRMQRGVLVVAPESRWDAP